MIFVLDQDTYALTERTADISCCSAFARRGRGKQSERRSQSPRHRVHTLTTNDSRRTEDMMRDRRSERDPDRVEMNWLGENSWVWWWSEVKPSSASNFPKHEEYSWFRTMCTLIVTRGSVWPIKPANPASAPRPLILKLLQLGARPASPARGRPRASTLIKSPPGSLGCVGEPSSAYRNTNVLTCVPPPIVHGSPSMEACSD